MGMNADESSYPVLWGKKIINHEIRIPSLNNQYFLESKNVFFFRDSSGTAQKQGISPRSSKISPYEYNVGAKTSYKKGCKFELHAYIYIYIL